MMSQQFQTHLHPIGRGDSLDPFPDGSKIAAASLRVFYGNRRFRELSWTDKRGQRTQRQIIDRRQFTRQAIMSPEVRPVGHGLIVNFQNQIVELEDIRHFFTVFGSGKMGQIHDLMFVGGRKKTFQTHFAGRTDHAIRADATQFGAFDFDRFSLAMPAHPGTWNRHNNLLTDFQVAAATDNLQFFRPADIDLYNTQTVGIGMCRYGGNRTHEYAFQAIGTVFYVLHLYRTHGQVRTQLFRAQVSG